MREDGIAAAPRRVVVVGAGVVGLSTAWFLQEHGVEVTVVDRAGVAAGSSWGNAGYLAPTFSIPLPEPSVLRYGLRSLLDRNAPLYVPARVDPGLWSFLAKFAAHCTMPAWQRAMQPYVPLNNECLDAFDELTSGGVQAPTNSAPITAAFAKAEQVADLRHEFDLVRDAGQDVSIAEVDPSEAGVPQLAQGIEAVMRIEGQRYVDPGEFVRSLARSVQERGGEIRSGFAVEDVRRGPGGGVTVVSGAEQLSADAVVLATGAWLSKLAK